MIGKLNKYYWFVLRVTYSRELKVKTILDGMEIECFIPMRCIETEINGTVEKIIEPAIHNLLFVHTTKERLDILKRETCLSTQIRYMMDGETHYPLIVPDKQMEDFIAVSGMYNEQVLYLDPHEVTLKKGDRVRVKEGTLKGVEGKFVRVKKGLRVVVSIKGLASIATASMHPSLVEKLNNNGNDNGF